MADSKTRRTVRPRLVYTHILENIDIVKGLACAHDHGGKRIVDNSDGQIGLVAQKLIEALQERAAAGEHDAAVNDVGRQLGRGLLEGDAHGLDNAVHLLGYGLCDFLGGDGGCFSGCRREGRGP